MTWTAPTNTARTGPTGGVQGGGAAASGGGLDYIPAVLGTLSDSNGYADKAGTEHNSSTGLVKFVTNATNLGSVALTGPATSEACPTYSMRLDNLDGFDPANHILKVEFSSVSLPNAAGRLGIAAFVSPDEFGGSSTAGGCGVCAFGASNDDRGAEMSNTSGVAGTPMVPAGKITDATCFFWFLASGQVVCNIWYSGSSSPEEKFRGSRRDIVMASGRLDADEIWLQISMIKFLTTAAPDETEVSAIVKVGYLEIGD